MSGDIIGGSDNNLTSERRISSRPNTVDDVARQVRSHVNELNRLFIDAKKLGLQVELVILNNKNTEDALDPDTDAHIMITKLRIEKDY